jgi:galactonate dehydratase
MTDAISIQRVRFAQVRVSQATEWTFAEVSDTSGSTALVEITCGARSSDAVEKLSALVSALKGKPVENEREVQTVCGMSDAALQADRASAAAVSGLRTAVVILQALQNSVSLTAQLGGEDAESVQLYANINRAMLGKDRTPQSFAALAERAVRAGFRIVKCAPFEEVRPPSTPGKILTDAATGLARVKAVRDAIGPDIRLLVDCHGRFEPHSAPIIGERLAALGVGWFEEPLEPTEYAAELADLGKIAAVPLAGGENGYGVDFFRSLVSTGAVRTIMPDIKYCGGASEAYAAGAAVSEIGGQVSLHSPSGTASLLAGAHCTAALTNAMPLEHAVYEAEWRAELMVPAERVESGRLWFPGGAGLGASLNPAVVARYGRLWEP